MSHHENSNLSSLQRLQHASLLCFLFGWLLVCFALVLAIVQLIQLASRKGFASALIPLPF